MEKRSRWRAVMGSYFLASLPFFLVAAPAKAQSFGQVLIEPGSEWKYWDMGGVPPFSDWKSQFYNDSDWSSGPAQLGYGDGDEATVVSYGGDPDSKYITTYFRRAFTIGNPADFNQLTLSLLRDDGAIVYLNGVEIHRSNMPLGSVDANTLAVTNVAGEGERTFYSVKIDASQLSGGFNVIAVEVHQAGVDSIDLSFDLSLAASNVVRLSRGPYLQQGTTSNIVVRWRSSGPAISRVRFSADLSNPPLIAEDLSPKTEHEMKLTGLSADTRYYYAVETEEAVLANATFVTAPLAAKPTRIWVLGDSGTANFIAQSVRDAYYAFTGSRETDLWLMLGDNAYYSGTDLEYQYAVFDMYPEMLRKSVLWTTIGNHETYSSDQSGDFSYLHIFTLPTQGEAGGIASGTKRYYSFNYGNIHFVCLDAMTSDRTPGSPMLHWLEQDLQANTNEWLIAFWHHPPYSKGTHDSDWEIELVQMRQYAVPILEKYGVDLVLGGHSHVYERSYLIDGHYGTSATFLPSMKVDSGDGRINGDGAYYKPTDGPHAHEGAVYCVAGSSGQTGFGQLNHPAMFVSMSVVGSMVLDISGNVLKAQFLDSDQQILDYFTIVKASRIQAPRFTTLCYEDARANIWFDSVTGRSYQLQYKLKLDDPEWISISDPVTATGDSTFMYARVPGDPPTVFFQLLLIE